MSSLFPQPEAPSPLVGIARLAAREKPSPKVIKSNI